MERDTDQGLIHALQDPALYDHPVQNFRVVETHISWVLLTGPYAYKIKKPVDLGFLDFSTLDKRRFYCAEELRLNRRLAPQLYLEVTAITGTPGKPQLGGTGPAVEYAVKMVQFPQDAQLDRVLARGALHNGHIDSLAGTVAAFHARAAIAPAASPFGRPARVHEPVMENFTQIEARIEITEDKAGLERLRAWCVGEHKARYADLARRKNDGFIRECHGDMHLANMALIEGEVVLFDCIEFNENLRWIDVMSEVAFLTMDLEDRGRPDLAYRFLNDYLGSGGDYAGLTVLRYYAVYRALVRAKVAAIRLDQPDLSPGERAAIGELYHSYLVLAAGYITAPHPMLLITHGLSGSGKTYLTQALLEQRRAIRLRSDVERKRLFGYGAAARTRAGVAGGIYTPAAGRRTYERLAELAQIVVAAGYTVIVDATFLKRAQRDAFRNLAGRLGVPFAVLDFQAQETTLRRRIVARHTGGRDASEADLAVLDHQLASREPLAPEEQADVVAVDSERDDGMARAATVLDRRAD